MDLSSLEIFLVVAEEGSVTHAAKLLGRAPSNVTTRIQLLEERLETTLFSRNGKKMTLTPQGQIFSAYAKKLTALAEEARLALRTGDPANILRIGTMESTAASRLPPALARFTETKPEISLRLTLGATRELTKAVAAGELDCALVAIPPGRPEWLSSAGVDLKGIHAVPVYQEELLLVLPPHHSPVGGPEDIRPQALAALEPGCTYRQIAERWMGDGTNLPTVEMTSYHAILAQVVAGNAVGVIPRSVLDMLHWNGEVAVHGLGTVDTLLISRHEDRSDPLKAFEEIVLMSAASPQTLQ